MSFGPMTLMKIAQGVSVAAGVVGTISNMQAAAYQQAVAQRNAQLMEENARRAIEQSQREQEDWGQAAREQLGRLMADLGASGVAMGAGSALRRREGAGELAQRDAMRIREEGVTTAENFRQQAADFKGEAKMARRRKSFALFEGVVGTMGSYLGHATQINRARGLIA
jgi:hypothetical protein